MSKESQKNDILWTDFEGQGERNRMKHFGIFLALCCTGTLFGTKLAFAQSPGSVTGIFVNAVSHVVVPLGSPASYSASVSGSNPQPNTEWKVTGTPTYVWTANIGTPNPTTDFSTVVTAAASTLSQSQVYTSTVRCKVTYAVQKVDPGKPDNGEQSVITGNNTATVQIYVISASFGSQPPSRIPISGTISHTYPISVTISPSSLPSGTAISVSAVSSGSGGAASVSPSTIASSGSVTLQGTSNSGAANNMTLQAALGGTILATSNAFTVSTWPTALALAAVTTTKPDGTVVVAPDDYGLTVDLLWTSESGSVADLGNCKWIEVCSEKQWENPPYSIHASFMQYGDVISDISKDLDVHKLDPGDIDYNLAGAPLAPPTTFPYIIDQSYTWWDTVLNTAPQSIYSDVITHKVIVVNSDEFSISTSVVNTSQPFSATPDPEEGPRAE